MLLFHLRASLQVREPPFGALPGISQLCNDALLSRQRFLVLGLRRTTQRGGSHWHGRNSFGDSARHDPTKYRVLERWSIFAQSESSLLQQIEVVLGTDDHVDVRRLVELGIC